ncbi:MAG TPA: hypothetical protein VMT59_07435 [Gaiellaceae bacterium]|nr:hypothetical protein [Gaiellaceae bacterium]
MCCTFLLAFGIGPRIALIFVWIFSSRIGDAFSSWIWPALGFVFLPWTTLMYVLAWGPVYGVSGWGWVLVALGLCLDAATYSGGYAKDRYSPAT